MFRQEQVDLPNAEENILGAQRQLASFGAVRYVGA